MKKLTLLKEEVLNRLQFQSFTAMQEETMQSIVNGQDTLLLSPTGTGKTLAFLLPTIAKIDAKDSFVKAMIIVPTRELALQIGQTLQSLKTEVKAVVCYGGRPAMEEARQIRNTNPQIIIGTPGRLVDHLSKENFLVEKIEMLILDEFDKSLEMGFLAEMETLLQFLCFLKQRVLTSATNLLHIPSFVGLSSKVNKLDFLTVNKSSERIKEYVVESPENDKLNTLGVLLSKIEGATLVFVNYRESVERVATYLKEYKFPLATFHGGLTQEERERSLYALKSGAITILVTTDLSARGLDIDDVKNIVHYHPSLQKEAYLHRCGRTGRWEGEGNSFLILNPKETLPQYAERCLPYIIDDTTEICAKPTPWVVLYFGKGKKEKISKADILGFLCKKGGLQSADIGKIDVKEYQAYASIRREKVKDCLKAIKGEKIKGVKLKIEEAKFL